VVSNVPPAVVFELENKVKKHDDRIDSIERAIDRLHQVGGWIVGGLSALIMVVAAIFVLLTWYSYRSHRDEHRKEIESFKEAGQKMLGELAANVQLELTREKEKVQELTAKATAEHEQMRRAHEQSLADVARLTVAQQALEASKTALLEKLKDYQTPAQIQEAVMEKMAQTYDPPDTIRAKILRDILFTITSYKDFSDEAKVRIRDRLEGMLDKLLQMDFEKYGNNSKKAAPPTGAPGTAPPAPE
jgi:DNA repair exonuclease SbcCD ATPase subunit